MDECLPCAPGGPNAARLWRGDSNALASEAAYALERIALVGAGLFLVGVRDQKLLRGAIAGGLMVEAFVLSYGYWKR